jgi:hypothetical protein
MPERERLRTVTELILAAGNSGHSSRHPSKSKGRSAAPNLHTCPNDHAKWRIRMCYQNALLGGRPSMRLGFVPGDRPAVPDSGIESDSAGARAGRRDRCKLWAHVLSVRCSLRFAVGS